MKQCEPSTRGELEITTVNDLYIQDGLMTWGELARMCLDCGSFDSLLEANRTVAEARHKGEKRFLPRLEPGSK